MSDMVKTDEQRMRTFFVLCIKVTRSNCGVGGMGRSALKAMDCARWLIGSKFFISAIWIKLSRMVIVAS